MRGNASSTHFVSCRQTMSGLRSASHVRAESMRCLIELTFQVAMRTSRSALKREAGAATAGRGGLWVVDLEGRANEIVDEIDFGAGHVIERNRVDQHHHAAAFDDDVVVGFAALGVEFVLVTRSSAAIDADRYHVIWRFPAKDSRC